MAAVKSTGSTRRTKVSGWKFWKYKDPKTGKEEKLKTFKK
jgi:hypothetical protein